MESKELKTYFQRWINSNLILLSMSSDQLSQLPESSSYAEITGQSTPSPVETAIGDVPQAEMIRSVMWRVGDPSSTTLNDADGQIDNPSIGFDRSVSVYSDTHPDVVANLVAEYYADTVLRIDSAAVVDIAVTVKQDLVVITGEIGCSHPAKSAIIHSDQFQSTLNGSIREIFKEIGFDAGHPPAVSSLQPPAQNSPLRKPVAASPGGVPGVSIPAIAEDSSKVKNSDDDILIDPAHLHIIMAITDGMRDLKTGGVICRARARENEVHPVARVVCKTVSTYLRSKKHPLVGGISVDVFPDTDSSIRSIGISFYAPTNLGDIVKEMRETCLSGDSLRSLSPYILNNTKISIQHANRLGMTGRSLCSTGKSWDDPRRYGQALARLGATNLVKNGACAECEVALHLSDSIGIENEIALVNIGINQFGSSKASKTILETNIITPFHRKSVREIRDSILKDPNATFFALDHGGSACLDEFVIDTQ